MKQALLSAVVSASLFSFAQQPTHPNQAAQPSSAPSQSAQQQAADQPVQPAQQPAPGQPVSQPAATQPKGCLAVKPIGSHAFRNIVLFGVAGALVSKQQYQVVDAVNYPARVGQKFHGNDLQTVAANGTRVVILDKHYTAEDLHKACQ